MQAATLGKSSKFNSALFFIKSFKPTIILLKLVPERNKPDLCGAKKRYFKNPFAQTLFIIPKFIDPMRTSQQIKASNSYRMTPAQRRLSAAHTGPGMRTPARRSALQPARRAEFTVAVAGSLLILSFLIALLAM